MPLFIIPVDGGRRNKVVCIPKPPKIGCAYIKRSRKPTTDQDWLQSVMLNEKPLRRTWWHVLLDVEPRHE